MLQGATRDAPVRTASAQDQGSFFSPIPNRVTCRKSAATVATVPLTAPQNTVSAASTGRVSAEPVRADSLAHSSAALGMHDVMWGQSPHITQTPRLTTRMRPARPHRHHITRLQAAVRHRGTRSDLRTCSRTARTTLSLPGRHDRSQKYEPPWTICSRRTRRPLALINSWTLRTGKRETRGCPAYH